MATISFLYRSTKSKAPITLRLLYRWGGKDYVHGSKTKLLVHGDYWKNIHSANKKNETAEIKNLRLELNSELVKIENFILEAFHNEFDIKSINKEWLVNTIYKYYNPVDKSPQSDTILYWIDYMVENAHLKANSKGNYGLSYNRVKAYRNLKTTLKEYQERDLLRVVDFSLAKFNDLHKWLINKKKYAPSTAIKKLTDLQVVIKEAKKNRAVIADDFDYVKFSKVETYDDDMDVITLSEEDIDKIESVNLDSDALINARKYLILSCFTGQRGNDLINRIIEDNFESYGSDLVIKFKQEKGRLPSLTSPDPWEKRMAEGIAFLQKKAVEAKNG
jgi:hypothetical protein